MKNVLIFFIIFMLGVSYAKINSGNNAFANSSSYQISACSPAVAWMIDTNSGDIYKVYDPIVGGDRRIELIYSPSLKK